MTDNQSFFRGWETAKELVLDRGYTISDKYNKLSEMDINYLINNDTLDMIGEKPNKDKIYIKFINMIRIKVAYLQAIIDDIKKNYDNITIVFITKCKPSSIIKKIESKERNNVQVFYLKRLQVNPTGHSLVPLHIKISNDEIKDILHKYHLLCKSQLPVLLQSDAIAKYYNFKKEDIIKIISKQKKDYNKIYKFTGKKLTEKELILERNLIKNKLITRRKSLIDRRNELVKYFNANCADNILRYRYVK